MTRVIRGRRGLLAAAVAVLVLMAAGPAYSFWTATSSGPYGRAVASTLATPVLSTGTVTDTSAGLSWTQPFTPTSYTLGQSPGSIAGCSATPSVASTSCTATGLTPNTSYTWTLGARLHSWNSPAQASVTTSKQATTTTLSNLTPTTGAAGSSFSATATVTGNSGFGTPAGTVVLSLYTSPTCSGAASYASSAQTLTAGAASASLQPAVGTYYWQAAYTPTDTFNVASASACSSAVTVTPVGAIFHGIGPPLTRTSSGDNLVLDYAAGTTAGDLMLVVVVNNTSQDSEMKSAGWTEIAKPRVGGVGGMELQAWWHTAGAETSALIEIKTNGNGATAWAVTYENLPNPVMGAVSSGTASPLLGVNSLRPPNLTTTGANATVISLVGINAPNTVSLSSPQSFVTRVAQSVGFLTGRGLGIADRFVPTAGTVTSPTWTEGLLGSQWAYITVGFR